MVVVGSTVATLVATANSHSDFLKGKTVEAYPDTYFSTPLKQTMFSLGIKQIEVGPRIETADSSGNVTVTKNRQVKIRFALNVYAPKSMGGEACSQGFDRWLDMVVRMLHMDISDAGCGEVEYESSIGTNVLKGYFTYTRITSENIPVT